MAALTAAGTLALVAACSTAPATPTVAPISAAVIVQNREAVAVEIQAEDAAGRNVGFRAPSGSWVSLPGNAWTVVHLVSADCTIVSGAAVDPRSRPTAIFILDGGTLALAPAGTLAPTSGPLASAPASDLCPNGPHYPGQTPASP